MSRALLLLLPACLWGPIGCGPRDGRVAITDVRMVSDGDRGPTRTPNSRERFEGGGHGIPAGNPRSNAENHAVQRPLYAWLAPPDWVVLPSGGDRLVALAPPGEPAAVLTLTRLHGGAGGLARNLDRWRGRMGRPPLDDAARAALPRIAVLGAEVPLLEVRGTFTPMHGEALADAMLLGVVVPRAGETLFVKMTGPATVLVRERASFEAFCRSLREGG